MAKLSDFAGMLHRPMNLDCGSYDIPLCGNDFYSAVELAQPLPVSTSDHLLLLEHGYQVIRCAGVLVP